MDYIQKIKEKRLAQNITQVEMSRKLGMSASAYGLYETGQRHMDVETLAKVCKILHISADEILGLKYKG